MINVDHHHDNSRFGDRQPRRRRGVVDGRAARRHLSRARGRPHAGDRGGAVHGARDRHGSLPVHEHDAEGVPARCRSGRAGADAHKVFQGVYETVQFAKLKLLARALERAQVYAGGRVVVSYLLRADFPRSAQSSRTRRASSTACAPSKARCWQRSFASRRATAVPPRKVSLRSSVDEIDVSAIARRIGRRRAPQAAGFSSDLSIDEITPLHRLRVRGGRRRRSQRGLMAIPKGLDPTGVILVDKPAGPSSFAVVASVRGRTRAKTGHAGTLDPFATGLLLLLSGRATKLASCFVGLDKRYLTEIDLSRTDCNRRPRGRRDRPSRASLPAPSSKRPWHGSAVTSSCRSRPHRRSRSAASVRTACTGRGSWSRCPCAAHASTRSKSIDSGWPAFVTLDLRVSSGHLRAIDRRRARRPLRGAAAHRGRAVPGRGGRRRAGTRRRRGARPHRAHACCGGDRAPGSSRGGAR